MVLGAFWQISFPWNLSAPVSAPGAESACQIQKALHLPYCFPRSFPSEGSGFLKLIPMWGWFPHCLGQRFHGGDAACRECFSFIVRLLSAEYSEIYVAGCCYYECMCTCVCAHTRARACVYTWTCIHMQARGQTLGRCSSSTISCFLFFGDRICRWPGHFLHLLGWLPASQAPQVYRSLPPQGCSINELSCYKFEKLFSAVLRWFPFLLLSFGAHICLPVSQCLFSLVKSVRDRPRKGSRSEPLCFCNALIALALLSASLDGSQILNFQLSSYCPFIF